MAVATSRIQRFYEISRVRENDDGTCHVEGIAATEGRADDGLIITREAMRGALPEYLRFPTIREMHQLVAAGTTESAEVADDGNTYIVAHIVDPNAVLKVKHGVYRAFSVKGSIPRDGRDAADPSIIRKFRLTEISIVDRPGDPGAVFTVVRAGDAPESDMSDAVAEPATTATAEVPVDAAPAAAAPVDAAPEAAAAAPEAAAVERAAEDAAPAEAAAVAAPADPPAAEQPVVEEPAAVERGSMYSVAMGAEVLHALKNLADNCAFDCSVFGGSPAVPAKMHAALVAAVDGFRSLVDESLAALVAQPVDGSAPAPALEMRAADAEKLGAALVRALNTAATLTVAVKDGLSEVETERVGMRFSRGTKLALTEIHGMIRRSDELMRALGYEGAEEEEGVEGEDAGDKETEKDDAEQAGKDKANPFAKKDGEEGADAEGKEKPEDKDAAAAEAAKKPGAEDEDAEAAAKKKKNPFARAADEGELERLNAAIAASAADVERLGGDVTRLTTERDDALKRAAKAEADLADANAKLQTKGVLRAVPVSKDEDDPLARGRNDEPDPTDPLASVKRAHRQPFRFTP